MNKNKITKKREIDRMVEGVYGWLGDSFVLIRKTTVKTWQGVFIIAFVAGVFAALIWSVAFNIQSKTTAIGETASLRINPANITVAQGGDFSVDVMLNTGGKNVVATRAMINYDTSDFTLVGWNTDNSIFSSGNGCIYNNKPCEIVKSDTANGKISIVLAKPAPGVNTLNGKVATLNFKATSTAQTDNIFITFWGTDKYQDSDVIMDGIGSGGAGMDILSSVTNASVQVTVPVIACTDFTYSDWGVCQNGTQTRTVTISSPVNCTGGSPVLSQSCQNTCTDFTYSAWSTCQNGAQSRTVTLSSPSGCTGGNPVLTQSCQTNIDANICTSFTYYKWGSCINGIRSRKIKSSSPVGCTGGSPYLTKACITR